MSLPESAAAARAVPASADRVTAGILFILAGFALFTTMDASVKLLSARYSTLQIVTVNSFLAALLPAVVVTMKQGLEGLRSRRPFLQLVRGLAMLGGVNLVFFGFSRLPMADVYAVLFTMPLIITALSMPLLGERVGWRRWAAVVAGFTGVLVMLAPTGAPVEWAALGVLAAAFMNALAMILVRVMRGDGAFAFVVWGNLTVALGTAPLMLPQWITPAAADLPLFLFAGIAAGTAYLCLARAYQLAPAAVIAPYQYSQMVFGIVFGILLFGQWPGLRTLTGAAIVILCGLYVFHRETRLKAQP